MIKNVITNIDNLNIFCLTGFKPNIIDRVKGLFSKTQKLKNLGFNTDIMQEVLEFEGDDVLIKYEVDKREEKKHKDVLGYVHWSLVFDEPPIAIYLNTKQLLKLKLDRSEIKTIIYHELYHYKQRLKKEVYGHNPKSIEEVEAEKFAIDNLKLTASQYKEFIWKANYVWKKKKLIDKYVRKGIAPNSIVKLAYLHAKEKYGE